MFANYTKETTAAKSAMDAPGPSGVATKKAKEKELEQAYDDLVEKVSVAGWKEALSEHVSWIRRCFLLSLLVLSGFCLYYNGQSAMRWVNADGFSNEFTDFANLESLPFSNVTICASQIYFNKTFLKETLNIPPRLIEAYKNATGPSTTAEDFYEHLSLFMSLILRPRNFSLIQLVYFSKVLHMNPYLVDYSAFASSAVLQCENMLKRCLFNGQEFNCCSMAVQVLEDDGVCYLLALNFDSDNAAPSNKTIHQTRPGPAGGLFVEASFKTDEFPWLEQDAHNGFRVYVNHASFTGKYSPVAAPHASEIFVKVTPTMQSVSQNCAPYGHLSGTEFGYHDPKGENCIGQEGAATLIRLSGCATAVYTYKPNASIVCGPMTMYWIGVFSSASALDSMLQKMYMRDDGQPSHAISRKQVENLANETEKQFHSVLVETQCKTHCRYWTYSTVSSFVDLEKSSGSLKNEVYARIHVYYGDLSYREYREEKQQKVYLAFCDFGNLVGLYWGMSIVSFFHVFYYLTCYVMARRRVTEVDETPVIRLKHEPKRVIKRLYRKVSPDVTTRL